ncbi:MAG: ABC transporter ATP-binding protein [Hyphomonadaceae bacterium]
MRAETLPDFAIEARGLEKTYRGDSRTPPVHALKGVDLAIPRGSFFGLLGPNGAGKSTFINILAGLVLKTGGSARIWGYDIDTHGREAKGAIGIVPQEIVSDPFFTPYETMEQIAGFYGVPKNERRTMEILRAVGLGDKYRAYQRSLSGGMKRRLLVAKALVHNPPVVVLDEPTAGVDVELRRSLWEYVRELHASGVTIVLTTHYLEEAQDLCDTIAIFNHGQVVACEPTAQILQRLDHRTLVIHGETPFETAPIALGGLETNIRPDGGLAIVYRVGEQTVEQVLDRVRGAGVGIKDLTVQTPDLEDVFVALTSKPAA